MNVDPVASLRCWEIEVYLEGRTIIVPALPAADWWPVLTQADPVAVLDIVMSTSGDLDELLLSGQVTLEELGDALTDAVEQAAGRSFWAACLLAEIATRSWPAINGELASHGFRWDVAPLGAALDAVYATIRSNITEQAKLDQFHALLDRPVTIAGGRVQVDQDKAMAEFEAVAGPKPSAAPAGVVVSKGGKTPRSGVSAQTERSNAEPSGSELPKTRRPRRPRHQAAP